MTKKTIEIGPSQLRAHVGPTTLNEDRRTVDLTWTTGSKGIRTDAFGTRYYEELSLKPEHLNLERLNDGSHPLLAAHDDTNLDSVIGVVERAWIEGDRAGATVRFAKDEFSERVFQKVKDKILRNVSVGYSVFQYDDVTKEGDKIRTYRATNWAPAELSIVPVGFDRMAKIRGESKTQTVEIKNTSETEIHTRAESAKGNTMSDVLNERTRIKQIQNMVRNAGLDQTFEDDLIDRGVSADEARKAVLEEMSKKPAPAAQIDTATRVEVGMSGSERKRDLIVDTLVQRFGGPEAPKDARIFQGRSFLQNLEHVIPRRLGQTDQQFATRAMSSSDLPYILANVGEKSIANRLKLAQPTWKQWASQGTLRNFKEHSLLKSSAWPSLQERQEGGEFQYGSLSEDREQVALKEFGVALAFTRRMLINDDLNELQNMIGQSAVAVNALENSLVYSVLTSNPAMADGYAVFSSEHSNLLSAAALTDSTIGEAFKKMREQTSIDGRKLNMAPQFLICGPDQEMAARKYLAQISPAQASNVNPFSQSLQLVVDAEITSNDYFFAASPSLNAGVSLFHLEGEESPRVESRNRFETENVEIKVAHSAVAKAVDHRGLCKSANAS